MDALSSSNVSRIRQRNPNQHHRGVDNEFIKIENSKLWFMGGPEHNRLIGIIKEGDFQIRMIIQYLSPALMMKCSVDTLEWPLTRDSLVLRVGSRSFAFAMPGLLYGLQFPSNCHQEIVESLERIFMRFGWYEDYSPRENGRTIFGYDVDPYFWLRSERVIDYISQSLLKELGTYWKRFEIPNQKMDDWVLRVEHMSFVVKLITKGLLIGKIDPTKHIVVIGKSWAIKDDDDDGDEIESRVSPTIFLFSNLVEAFKESKVLMNLQYHMTTPYDSRWTPTPNTTFWNINKAGLFMILPVIKGALGINFKVSVKPLIDHSYNKFFVPLKIKSDENKGDRIVSLREIRFPIMDEVGFTYKSKIVAEQLGVAWANLELQGTK